jgi:signal transduction histidine kinase
MPRFEARLSYLIYCGVAVLIGVMLWLAQGRHVVLGVVEALAAAILIACGGGFLVLRYVVLPIRRMSGTVIAIAGGDYSLAVPYVDRRDEIGQMARSLSTIRNALLELKSAQTQAEAASRHKSDFIANMSHELRTPLNAIIGLSDMLLEDADNPDTRELKESLPRIGTAAKHLLSLINEILDLSRIEAGRMAVKISAFKPAMLAEESLATVAPIARQKGLKLVANHPRQLPAIESDPGRVRQILINLLGNAVKFTDAGEVRIEVSASDEKVRFAVIDTGPGIAQEDIDRLFQDFTQLDASSTRKFGGSGLGLALSRRLARLLGGDVTLASMVGTGSTFVLELPLNAPADRGAVEVEASAASTAALTAESGGDRA